MKKFILALATLVGPVTMAHAVQWVHADSPNASQATFISYERGNPNIRLYFCREIRDDGKTNVGKAVVYSGNPISSAICYVPHKTKQYDVGRRFELLILNESWTFADSRISHAPIHLDSYEFRTGEETFGCIDGNSAIIGKYFTSSKACYVPEGGKEYEIKDPRVFKVLAHN